MSSEIIKFAETTYRNQLKEFGIKTDDRRRHMYLIGKTGMGKSTIQENMIVEDIRAGHGVAVVDPHGDLAEKIIQFIPKHRINDVVYFNPADQDYPIAFNIVEHVDSSMRHLVASGLVGVFQKLWAESWGPRLEYILRNAILAVLDYKGSTLLSVVRMLSDKKFRKKIVENIENPVVKAFWVTEFAGYNDKFASEAVAPIQNKVGQFLSTTLIRNIVGQTKSSLDMRKIMDEKKILILNLSKGRIGEDNSALLGAMMITKLSLAAMSRVDILEKDRKDFFLYVDEFQNFATDAFAGILSEARKYRLSLILAHQYIEQLPETVRNAVFGNVGTLVTFRVGAADAEALAPEFFPTFLAEDIVNLPKYEIYLKLMIDGIASEPFSARGLRPLTESEKTGTLEKVIQSSRERYGESRVEVEEAIAKWHEEDSGPVGGKNNNGGVQKKNTANNKPDHIYKYKANCAKCSKETRLPFEPDGVRPVYCTDCLSDLKNDKKQESEKRKSAKVEEIKSIKKEPVVVNKKVVQPPIQPQAKPVTSSVTQPIKTATNNIQPSPKLAVTPRPVAQALQQKEKLVLKVDRPRVEIKKPQPQSQFKTQPQLQPQSQVLQAKKVVKEEKPVMSLNDAFQMGAVNFSGKKMQKNIKTDQGINAQSKPIQKDLKFPVKSDNFKNNNGDANTVRPNQSKVVNDINDKVVNKVVPQKQDNSSPVDISGSSMKEDQEIKF